MIVDGDTKKTITTTFETEGLPSAFRNATAPAFVCWRAEEREGKTTKIPYSPCSPRRRASSTNAKTWATFGEAISTAERDPTLGIGVVLSAQNDLMMIDLDDCRDPESGKFSSEAWALIEQLDSYTEVSPSGRGAKVFLRARVDLRGNKRANVHGCGAVEVYAKERYGTLTGRRIDEVSHEVEHRQSEVESLVAALFPTEDALAPATRSTRTSVSPVLGDEDIIDKCRAARNAGKFTALFDRGDASAVGGDDSRADAALAAMLAFYSDDAEQIERLMRLSSLVRPKWRRPDYLSRTIAFVLRQRGRERWDGNGQMLDVDSIDSRLGDVPDWMKGVGEGEHEGEGVRSTREPEKPTLIEPIDEYRSIRVDGIAGKRMRCILLDKGKPRSPEFLLPMTGDRFGDASTAIADALGTSTHSAIMRPVRLALRRLRNRREEIKAAFEHRVEEKETTGFTMREGLAAYIRRRWDLRFALVDRTYWSEAFEGYVRKGEVKDDVSEEVCGIIARATDCPCDVEGNRISHDLDLIKTAQQMMKSAVSDVIQQVPTREAKETGLGPDSAAAKTFQHDLITAMVRPDSRVSVPLDNGEKYSFEASAVGIICEWIRGGEYELGEWVRPRPQIAVWFLIDSERRTWLGVRPEWITAMKSRPARFRSLTEPSDFAQVARRYALLADDVESPSRRLPRDVRGRRDQLCVLSQDITSNIFASALATERAAWEKARQAAQGGDDAFAF